MINRANRNNKFKSTVFGEYLMEQFFFKIITDKPKKGRLEDLNQQQLQHDHMVTIVHEYMHYLHEISTHIGTFFLAYAATIRALLSRYVDPDLSTSAFNLDISLPDVKLLADLKDTIEVLLGDTSPENGLKEVAGYELKEISINVPHEKSTQISQLEIPEIDFNEHDQVRKIAFGKFFLYEGLAYELEIVYSSSINREHGDEMDGTEYTVLRYLSRHIVPGITTHTMLRLAAMSLAYVNCGAMFIAMLERLAIELKAGRDDAYLLSIVRKKTISDYAERSKILKGVLTEIEDAFKGRSSLEIAYADLKQNYIIAAAERIKNPAFEVDMIYNKQFNELLHLIPPCDFMWVFNNKNTFMRDLYGTTKSQIVNGEPIAIHHNIFIANVHYANVLFYTLNGDISYFNSGDDEICCPFYTSCSLQLRRDNPQICSTTPWITYDIGFANGKGYCWYGSGVGFLKGPDKTS
jgi:hypothetical protein